MWFNVVTSLLHCHGPFDHFFCAIKRRFNIVAIQHFLRWSCLIGIAVLVSNDTSGLVESSSGQ